MRLPAWGCPLGQLLGRRDLGQAGCGSLGPWPSPARVGGWHYGMVTPVLWGASLEMPMGLSCCFYGAEWPVWVKMGEAQAELGRTYLAARS